MIDILVYLFENYSDFPAHPEGGSLARKLSAVGFDELEIGAALEWLAVLRQSSAPAFVSQGMRVFTEAEQEQLEEGCLDFLVFLERARLVTGPVRELILDRALDLPGQSVSLERFKVIVLMVLWSREQELDPLIVEELLSDAVDPAACH
ncbi:MAG: DUF494 domain-containing protein [Azovibrio sp.]|uniref:DUF494 family protein n=1 Tax=Azovibrio sp. TaxID=1872673 RepID=UPI003C717141